MGLHFTGDAFCDFDAGSFEGCHFLRIIGQQPHSLQPESLQYLCRQLEFAMISLESELLIRLHGIESFILQLVGAELRHEADPAAFLHFIKEDPCAGLRDQGESHFELLAAIAAKRAEHVASEALGVNAYERWRSVDVAQNERDSFFLAAILCAVLGRKLAFKAHDAEVAPARGEIGFSVLVDDGSRTHQSNYNEPFTANMRANLLCCPELPSTIYFRV